MSKYEYVDDSTLMGEKRLPGEFCFYNEFPRGHYLVWWVRVKFSLGVRVSGRVRVMSRLGLGLVTY